MFRIKNFSRANDGVAALEMALVLPFLVLLFLGTMEISRYYLVYKRVNNVAASMVQVLSTSTVARPEHQLYYIANGIYTIPTIEPDTRKAEGFVWSSHNVSLSSVEFVPVNPKCTRANCKFDAMVRYAYSVDARQMRPCGKLDMAKKRDRLTLKNLPEVLYGSGSIAVVDIAYSYKPLFGARFFSEHTIFASAYMAPRYMPVLTFGPDKPPRLKVCS